MPIIPASKIIRSTRKTITLQITETGDLIVKAPLHLPVSTLQEFINEKQDWITENLRRIEKRKSLPRKYMNGEEFFYLGKPYKLNVGDFKEITVTQTLNYPKFLLFCIKNELARWYKRQAKEIITRRVVYHAEKMGVEYKGIMFSDTKSKWGTCGPDNALQFNWRLVMAPMIVIDYVVIHELVHTIEKNHSVKFWKQVGAVTPAYRQHRKWLKEHGNLLFT